MAQRNSEYARKERDLYETPEWVSQVILPYIPKYRVLWEPACATGKMAEVLKADHASDIVTGYGDVMDFLSVKELWRSKYKDVGAIVTNPPFGRIGAAFMRHAVELMRPVKGFVAMLAPMTFDAAHGRSDLFGSCHAYYGKVTLTERIVWFDDPDKDVSPSSNHAWYIWDWQNATTRIAPICLYHYPRANKEKLADVLWSTVP